ncbi:14-3-3 domain-containing protein [Mycena leptocephala]|nr:14-3-3 domain-containing protein [Mycena leptocephala]
MVQDTGSSGGCYSMGLERAWWILDPLQQSLEFDVSRVVQPNLLEYLEITSSVVIGVTARALITILQLQVDLAPHDGATPPTRPGNFGELLRDQELTLDERTLFASACGNLVKRLRYSCKATSLVESHPELPGDRTVITTAYRQRVHKDGHGSRVHPRILQDHLMKSTQSRESLVFFRKMIGDFYRYLAEFSIEVERKDYTDQALESYMMASHLAANHPEMPLTHPTRLALVINFSVFYHDILQNHDAALEHSCQAFNDGVKHLDWLTEETCTESILLLQILKDNSTIWSLTKNVNTQPQAA